MIPADSPLRNPPESMPPEQRVAFDGLRYAADMVALAADRLHSDLLEVTSAREKTVSLDPTAFARCFANVWSLVDNMWRLNLLLIRVPGLKRTPEVVAHLKAIRSVEGFRHGFQHLDERVRSCAQDQLPLLGTLSWAHFPDGPQQPGRVFTMIPGSLRPGTAPVINPAGKAIHSAIALVTLSAFGIQIELPTLLRRLAALIAGIDAGLRKALATGSAGGASDVLLTLDFVPNPREARDVVAGA